MADVEDDLVAFLRGNVDGSIVSVAFDPGDASNTDLDGGVKHSDTDGHRDYPQVAVVGTDPITPGGGETGLTGIDPGGGGGVQDVVHLVRVDCWGGRDDDPIYQGGSTHPSKVAVALADEVHDVCFSVSGAAAPTGYEWINADEPFTNHDTESDDRTHYRRSLQVRMKRTNAP